MRALFRACERRRVRYLVIGGQAAVLHGASFFTQDLDLWVDPAPRKVRAFLASLADLKARIHKRTPPIAGNNLLRGHGFHFRIPQRGRSDVYLDMMGRPPRARSFGFAARRAVTMTTPWGELPVVSIEDLVELKKTNRPMDYEVISRLALIRLSQSSSPSTLRWALGNLFQVEDLWGVLQKAGPSVSRVPLPGAARVLRRAKSEDREPRGSEWSRAAGILAETAKHLQDRGRAYWLPRLRELKEMRVAGRLIPEGTPVRPSLAR